MARIQVDLIDPPLLEAKTPVRSHGHLIDGAEDVWRALEEQGAVLVSEPLAYHRDLHREDNVTLRTDRGPQALRIAGVYYDYSSNRGWVAMSRRTYESYWQGGG